MAKHSFRDPDTNVLKAWGHMDSNSPGDLMREEDNDFHLTPGEWYWDGENWLAYTPPAEPDIPGFMAALKAAMTLAESNTKLALYPLALPALLNEGWTDFEDLVILAHDNTDITDDLYNIVRTEATNANIPITLPALP